MTKNELLREWHSNKHPILANVEISDVDEVDRIRILTFEKKRDKISAQWMTKFAWTVRIIGFVIAFYAVVLAVTTLEDRVKNIVFWIYGPFFIIWLFAFPAIAVSGEKLYSYKSSTTRKLLDFGLSLCSTSFLFININYTNPTNRVILLMLTAIILLARVVVLVLCQSGAYFEKKIKKIKSKYENDVLKEKRKLEQERVAYVERLRMHALSLNISLCTYDEISRISISTRICPICRSELISNDRACIKVPVTKSKTVSMLIRGTFIPTTQFVEENEQFSAKSVSCPKCRYVYAQAIVSTLENADLKYYTVTGKSRRATDADYNKKSVNYNVFDFSKGYLLEEVYEEFIKKRNNEKLIYCKEFYRRKNV